MTNGFQHDDWVNFLVILIYILVNKNFPAKIKIQKFLAPNLKFKCLKIYRQLYKANAKRIRSNRHYCREICSFLFQRSKIRLKVRKSKKRKVAAKGAGRHLKIWDLSSNIVHNRLSNIYKREDRWTNP